MSKKIIINLALCLSVSYGLILEDLIVERNFPFIFEGRRVGYFLGSFDPLHKGHEEAATKLLEYSICDYVLIYPSWGGDNSYKRRADIDIRLDMLFAVFKDHPKVVVTRFNPKQLQNLFTNAHPQKESYRKISIKGMHLIGLIGVDRAEWALNNPKEAAYYLTGYNIPPQFECHTYGSCMALPVDSLILFEREGFHVIAKDYRIGDITIEKTVSFRDYAHVSSSVVKQRIKKGHSLKNWVSDSVINIVKKHSLYGSVKV